MIIQLSADRWNRQYDYVDLCELDFTVGQFAELYHIEFEKLPEDGLGDCYFSCVEVHSNMYLLFGACDAEVVPGIIFRMQGNNPSVKKSISEIKRELDLDEKQITWTQDHFYEPKWALVRQGDDGNEVEIDRFYRESIATHNMRIFEARGHKQCYTVREII